LDSTHACQGLFCPTHFAPACLIPTQTFILTQQAVVSTKPSPSHTLQAHKQKARRLQRLQQQMLAAIEKAKQLRSDNNFLAATYADDELAALRKEFVQLENTPLESGGSEATGPKRPTSTISLMHRNGRDKRTKVMKLRDELTSKKKTANPPKLKVVIH